MTPYTQRRAFPIILIGEFTLISKIIYHLNSSCDFPELGWGPWAGRNHNLQIRARIDRLVIPPSETTSLEGELQFLHESAGSDTYFVFRPEQRKPLSLERHDIRRKFSNITLVDQVSPDAIVIKIENASAAEIAHVLLDMLAFGRTYYIIRTSDCVLIPWTLLTPPSLEEILRHVPKGGFVTMNSIQSATSTDCFDISIVRQD